MLTFVTRTAASSFGSLNLIWCFSVKNAVSCWFLHRENTFIPLSQVSITLLNNTRSIVAMEPRRFINILSWRVTGSYWRARRFEQNLLNNKETFPFWSNWASKIVLRAIQFAWHPALHENPAIQVSSADHPHFDVIFGNESGINSHKWTRGENTGYKQSFKFITFFNDSNMFSL